MDTELIVQSLVDTVLRVTPKSQLLASLTSEQLQEELESRGKEVPTSGREEFRKICTRLRVLERDGVVDLGDILESVRADDDALWECIYDKDRVVDDNSGDLDIHSLISNWLENGEASAQEVSSRAVREFVSTISTEDLERVLLDSDIVNDRLLWAAIEDKEAILRQHHNHLQWMELLDHNGVSDALELLAKRVKDLGPAPRTSRTPDSDNDSTAKE